MAEQIIGSPENHELNQLAFIKAVRSKLQLQQIYGLGDRISLSDGSQVQLHHLLLASELNSVLFQRFSPHGRSPRYTHADSRTWPFGRC